MKKFAVLGALFILPVLAYLFFASGVNNFAKLPVLTSGVEDINTLKDSKGNPVTFKDRITVLGFLGDDILHKKGNAFNLNEKIYKRFNGFKDFQLLMIVPDGTQEQVRVLTEELGMFTDVGNWNFVFAGKDDITSVFESLKSPYALGGDLSTPYVFIIDKDLSLRGRMDEEQKQFGYDATSVADLNNNMIDDVKIILAEYRLALKKNNNASRRDSYLKKVNSNDEE